MAQLGYLPPGLRGFTAGEDAELRRQQMGFGQLGSMVQLQGALMQQQQMRQGLERETMFRSELGKLGPNPEPRQAAAVAMRFGKPEIAFQFFNQEEMRKSREGIAEQNRIAAGQRADEMNRLRGDIANAGIASREEIAERDRKLRRDLFRDKSETITRGQVIDPKDSSRLLEVDLKKYAGGSLGDPGVFGVAGREPTAAKRDETQATGKALLQTELDNLREHYRVLDEAKAIPSSSRGTVSNVTSWVQGSTPGQLAGRVVGTKEQDARNQIQSSRLRLMNAIKNATGMSAQMLNSNVELQTWLNSLTDPQMTVETNRGIIDAIENTFIKGTKKSLGKPKSVLEEADAIIGR